MPFPPGAGPDFAARAIGEKLSPRMPKGTPDAVIAKLNDELNAVLAMPDVKERLAGAGIEARGGTAAQLDAQMRDDHARYGKIVKEFGIQAD